MAMKHILVICIVFFTNIFVNARTPCVHRDYGKGGTVCVCNTTYCDTFPDIIRTAPGIITLYESNKSGKRFDEKTLEFSNNSLDSLQSNGKVVKINRNKRYQRIIGFGGAFTDAAAINILSLNEKLAQNLIFDYYSPNGSSYTMGRIPIAGTDFSVRNYTYDDISVNSTDFALKDFNLQEEDLKYKIPVIKLANSVAPDLKLFATAWTAPAWMKTSHNIIGNGTLIGQPGGPFYEAYAQYYVKFLNEYKDQGINLWGLTPLNQPTDGFLPDCTINCMGFTPETERDFIVEHLGPALSAAGFGKDIINIMIVDDQRPYLTNWTNIVLNDSSISQYVSGIAFHWYFNNISSPDILDLANQQFPQYFILSTEACTGFDADAPDRVSLGDWGRGEEYAFDIITDLLHYTAGWVDWNLALDTTGGPNWVNNFVDSAVIVNSTAQEYYKQPMYYSLAHFSKFLAPNSQRIDSIDSGNQSLNTIVLETPNGGTVLIALNQLNSSIPLEIIDPNIGGINTIVSPRSIQTYVWYQ